MLQKVYMSELFLDESYDDDRRAYLQHIHSAILDKLKALKIPQTSDLEEAGFMIIIFTRCFLPRFSKDLLNILKPGVNHCVLICDWTRLPPTSTTDLYNLLHGLYVAEGPDKSTDLLLKDFGHLDDQYKSQLTKALQLLFLQKTTIGWALPDGVYLPETASDPDTIINNFVAAAVCCVNPLSIDLHKLSEIEADLIQINQRILDNSHTKATRFVVVAGSKQQDLTTITKFLATAQFSSNAFDGISYRERWPDEFPSDYGERLFVSFFGLKNADVHWEYTYLVNKSPRRKYKFIVAFEGVSSMSQLKEIIKLDAIFTKQFPGTMIILSTNLDIFGESKFHDNVYYVNGAKLDGHNSSIVDRPFCLELDSGKLEGIVARYQTGAEELDTPEVVPCPMQKEGETTTAVGLECTKEAADVHCSAE